MPVYAPLGPRSDIARSYGRTPRMVDLFGRLTGQPFPWDRYAQVIVWNFGAGGMENTSATTLYDTAVLSADAVTDGFDLDGLISHELAHQWFGDLITCRSWEHIWLNEGFATYFSNLWFEERDGADGYQSGVRGNFDSVCGSDHADAPSSGAWYPGPTRTRARCSAARRIHTPRALRSSTCSA
jgi:aminopeptidase N